MDKILNYLGIARRSRHLVSGTDTVIRELQNNNLYLIFVANDASLQTKDKIIKKAFHYNIEVIDIYDSYDLSTSCGLTNAMMLGINDEGIAKAILKVIKES